MRPTEGASPLKTGVSKLPKRHHSAIKHFLRENLDFTYDLKANLTAKTKDKLDKHAKQLSVHSATHANNAVLSVIALVDFKKAFAHMEDVQPLQALL